MTTPEWLRQRGGEVRPGPLATTWFVYFDGEPQYSLTPVPAAGKHSCRVTQTINGRRLDRGSVQDTVEAALQAGLEELRQALGW
jgi:hypothetical protein